MSGEGGAIAEERPSVIRKVVTEALNEAEHNGMARPVTDEWVAIRMLASPALADLLAAERQRGREEARTAVEAKLSRIGRPLGGSGPFGACSGEQRGIEYAVEHLRKVLADIPAAVDRTGPRSAERAGSGVPGPSEDGESL